MPDCGACQLHHTELPLGPTCVAGSPASNVASRVVPVVLTFAPLSTMRSAKSSFAGRARTVRVAVWLVTLPPGLLIATEYWPP